MGAEEDCGEGRMGAEGSVTVERKQRFHFGGLGTLAAPVMHVRVSLRASALIPRTLQPSISNNLGRQVIAGSQQG